MPRTDKDFVVYHVGGDGDYGPAQLIEHRFPNSTTLVVFDARDDTDGQLQSERRTVDGSGTKMIVINRCVDETVGEVDFHINKFPLSSSILPSSPLADSEDPAYEHCRTWGENTELDRIVRLPTTTIDEVVARGIAPPPDVLSIDAQGAELRILRGAREALRKHVLAVVAEVEFSEIYAGQGLFDDQMRELTAHGFRLTEFYGSQNWYPGAPIAAGFMTVAEAGWLRYCGDFGGRPPVTRGAIDYRQLTGPQLVRLIGIAEAMYRLSYAVVLMDFLATAHPEEFAQFQADPRFTMINGYYNFTKSNHADYQADHLYFMKEIKVGFTR